MSTPQWFAEFERQEAMREERLDETRARVAEWRKGTSPHDEAMRERLKAAIARKDAERGRPLTDRERLNNIARMIQEIDPK